MKLLLIIALFVTVNGMAQDAAFNMPPKIVGIVSVFNGQTFINDPIRPHETYSKIWVHESNLKNISSQLTVGDGGCLTWDKQESHLDKVERWLRNSPPVWESGFSYKKLQLGLLNGEQLQFCFSISSGSYYKVNREAIHAKYIRINLNTDNILIGNKTVYIWVDDGEIKHSMNGILSENKRDVLLLWEIHLEILNEIVSVKEVIDNRGRMIGSY